MSEETELPTVDDVEQPQDGSEYHTWLNAEAVKKLNGQFANRLFAQHLGDGLIRLNFGDIMDADDPSYHTAIVITAGNAVSFAELIYRMGNAALEPVKINVSTSPTESQDNGGR